MIKLPYIVAILMFCSITSYATLSRKYNHKNPILNQEFDSVCYEIDNFKIVYPSRTEDELKLLSPSKVGMPYYDSTNKTVVVSTGTAAGDFSNISTGSNPTGW